MYKFLLVVHAIIAASMVGVILMQRSEGGGLAGGGSPAGLMTARGAADFLTRATTILAILFVLLSIALAGIATLDRKPAELDTSLARKPVSAPAAPPSAVPLAGSAPSTPVDAAPAAGAPPAAQPKSRNTGQPAPRAARPPAPAPAASTPTAPATGPDGNPQQ